MINSPVHNTNFTIYTDNDNSVAAVLSFDLGTVHTCAGTLLCLYPLNLYRDMKSNLHCTDACNDVVCFEKTTKPNDIPSPLFMCFMIEIMSVSLEFIRV